jgi:hypothetical protein
MFSPLWLANSSNSNLFIVTDIALASEYTGTFSNKATLLSSPYNLPSNFSFYAIYGIY